MLYFCYKLKTMKRILIILSVLIILFFSALIIVPIIFKPELKKLVQKELDAQIDAKVRFDNIDLGFFKVFPSLTLGVNDIYVIGNTPFENDTLFSAERVFIKLKVSDLFSGAPYRIRYVGLKKPVVNILVLENGMANYDIAKDIAVSEETQDFQEEEETFLLETDQMIIADAQFYYHDYAQVIALSGKGMDAEIEGLFGTDVSHIKTNIKLNAWTLNYDSIEYMHMIPVNLEAVIEANLSTNTYTFSESNLSVGELPLKLDGYFMLLDEGYEMDLSYQSPGGTLGQLLSLVPDYYGSEVKDAQIKGNVSFMGRVAGVYDSTGYPPFDLAVLIDDGTVKYPGLPSSVSNIQLDIKILNIGRDLESLKIELKKGAMNLGQDQVEMKMNLMPLLTDPFVDIDLNANISLSSIGEYYPLHDTKISGDIFRANLHMKGNLSALEKEDYSDFEAEGNLSVAKAMIETGALPYPLIISDVNINLSPSVLKVQHCQLKANNSDIKIGGNIGNFLAYYFTDEILKGHLSIQSDNFNTSDFYVFQEKSNDESSPSESDEPIESNDDPMQIPENLNIELSADFDRLSYDALLMENLQAKIHINEGAINISSMKAQTLGGKMESSGSYSTVDAPQFDLSIDLNDFSLAEMGDKISLVRHYFPMLAKSTGFANGSIHLSSVLDHDFMPILSSLDGSGNLQTTKVSFEDIRSLDLIASSLKINELKNPSLNKSRVDFEILEGKVYVKPFDFRFNNMEGTIGGWTNLDQQMEYNLSLNIPSEKFSGEAENVLNNMINNAALGDMQLDLSNYIPVGIMLSGLISDPQVSIKLDKTSGALADKLKENLQETIDQKKEEISAAAQAKADQILSDAEKSAQNILNEAQKQADKLVQEAQKNANKIKSEADKQAQNIIAEAKKKGPLAEIAARKTADEVKKQANNQADNMVSSTQKEADNILDTARKKADEIRKNAQKEADDLLKN